MLAVNGRDYLVEDLVAELTGTEGELLLRGLDARWTRDMIDSLQAMSETPRPRVADPRVALGGFKVRALHRLGNSLLSSGQYLRCHEALASVACSSPPLNFMRLYARYRHVCSMPPTGPEQQFAAYEGLLEE